MSEPILQEGLAAGQVNGDGGLEARLRWLYGEQGRLRALLEQTRTELGRINAEILRTQDEYCTTPQREEEFWQCQKRIWGYDPRDVLQEIEEAKKNPHAFADIL